jgi:hypothetical protein
MQMYTQNYSERDKLRHDPTQHACFPCHAEDDWHLQYVQASPTRPLRSNVSYFPGRASYYTPT